MNETLPEDTEDKVSYCEYGEHKESEFASKHGSSLGLCPNPGKFLDTKNGKFMPDLYSYKYNVVADLKTIRTPFYTANKYNYNPSNTITINIKDLFRYSSKYPEIIIYFWAEWEAQENYGTRVDSINGVWVATLKTLFSLPPVIHGYERRVNDTQGNAKCSLLVDLMNIARVV